MSTASYSHIYRVSSNGLLVQTQSNTRLGKFLARLRTGSKVATACGMRWNILMSYGLDRNRRNTSYRISMKPKSKIWVNAGRNGGEYYTPRPLIRAMIQVVKPKIDDRIYDGACGSAGFLCESYNYLRRGFASRASAFDQDSRRSPNGNLTTKQLEILQKNTFTGKEKFGLCDCHHEYDFAWH